MQPEHTPGYSANRRWRLAHPEARNAAKARNYNQTGPSSGEPWTQEEDRRVLAHTIPDRQLAAEINRSVRAIQIRRSRIKPS